jgi:hypothetical protein
MKTSDQVYPEPTIAPTQMKTSDQVYPEPTIAPTQIKTNSNSGNSFTAESSSSWVVAVIGVVCAVVVLSAINLMFWCVIKRRINIAGGQREPTAEEQHRAARNDYEPQHPTSNPIQPQIPQQPPSGLCVTSASIPEAVVVSEVPEAKPYHGQPFDSSAPF